MDKLLFTPGPLTTSITVKEAMLHDLGSRDVSFIQIVKEVREELLQLGNVSKDKGFETIIIQGSGTFGIESVISSAVPKSGRLLVLVNGAYGERIAKIATIHKIPFKVLTCDEDQVPDIEQTKKILSEETFTHMVIVQCETTSGIFNPIGDFGKLAEENNVTYIVDSMSAFGAVPVDIDASHIDFLISSSNKCIEGVPGFSFIIAKRESLIQCKDQADTLSLDLYAQWMGLENDGQFRFTPPVHSLLAFRQALVELQEEGGVAGRADRYRKNFNTLVVGMREMGFKEYLKPDHQGYIISSYHYPEHLAFDFRVFYNSLNDRGYIIYPGKLTKANCFRIGNIGRLYASDIQSLLAAIGDVKTQMGF